jgi:membrane associated rhomboid family serine protease
MLLLDWFPAVLYWKPPMAFYLAGGLVGMLSQVAAQARSTVPSLGASGAIAAVMGAFLVIYPRDRIRALLVIFIFVRVTFIPAAQKEIRGGYGERRGV